MFIAVCRMLAHKFVEKSTESNLNARKQKVGKSWWSFGWCGVLSRNTFNLIFQPLNIGFYFSFDCAAHL